MENNGYPTRKPYYYGSNTKKPYVNKGAEISKFQARKESSIKSFTESRDINIIRTSSINDAVDWVTKHPDWGNKLTDDERMEWIDKITRKIITYFASKGEELAVLYEEVKSRKDEIREKEILAEDIEAGSEVPEGTPLPLEDKE